MGAGQKVKKECRIKVHSLKFQEFPLKKILTDLVVM